MVGPPVVPSFEKDQSFQEDANSNLPNDSLKVPLKDKGILRRRPTFKNLSCETVNGRKVIYYRVGKGARIRLPGKKGSAVFIRAYEDAAAKRQIDLSFSIQSKRRELLDHLTKCIGRARHRSKIKGVEHSIDREWLEQILEEQNYCCALTGLPLVIDREKTRQTKVDPFIPSLDRINPSMGYVRGNVRVVIFAINAMLLDWGEDVFKKVASAYQKHKNNRRFTATE